MTFTFPKLPNSYDAWRTVEPEERAHAKDCPLHEDNVVSCPVSCGGCSCHLSPPCLHCMNHVPGECACPTPEDLKARAAETRADR